MSKLSDKMDERMERGEKISKEQLKVAKDISEKARKLHSDIRGSGGDGTPGGTLGTPIT